MKSMFLKILCLCLCVQTLTCSQLSQSGSGSEQTGKFQLLLHDAPPPAPIQAINITIIEVNLVRADGTIINVSDTVKTFNLLDFKASNPLELVSKDIPSGRYTQMRLVLRDNNTITVNGVTQPLKTPSGQQSGLKLDGYFEIAAGRVYSMTVHFDANQSVVYNPGPNRYDLKPVITIVSNSLVNGPFTVTSLIENETVVAELSPDGTLRLISTIDPRVEMRGIYYFNYGTRLLHLELSSVLCSTCTNVGSIPGSIFYNFPNSDITVSTWDTTSIVGSVGSGLLARTVTFTKTNSFSIDTSTGYTVLNVLATYPTGYNGKFGVLSLVPKTVAGRTFADVQQIQNQTATFVFKIPYKELPGGIPGGSKDYLATPIIAINLTDLKISAQNNGAVCGSVVSSAKNYLLTVPVADKLLNVNIDFTPIP